MKNYKLIAVISIAFAAALFAIGINESIHRGVANSYWLFMFSLAGLFAFGLARKAFEKQGTKEEIKEEKKDHSPLPKVHNAKNIATVAPQTFKAGSNLQNPKRKR
jgi:hypothetical protein